MSRASRAWQATPICICSFPSETFKKTEQRRNATEFCGQCSNYLQVTLFETLSCLTSGQANFEDQVTFAPLHGHPLHCSARCQKRYTTVSDAAHGWILCQLRVIRLQRGVTRRFLSRFATLFERVATLLQTYGETITVVAGSEVPPQAPYFCGCRFRVWALLFRCQ